MAWQQLTWIGVKEAGKKTWKPAAMVVGRWAADRAGNRGADIAMDKTKEHAERLAEDKRNRKLAQDLARQHGWRYSERLVVDHEYRCVVWNSERQPMAAFPPVDGAKEPQELAERWEFNGYVPADEDLIAPPSPASTPPGD